MYFSPEAYTLTLCPAMMMNFLASKRSHWKQFTV